MLTNKQIGELYLTQHSLNRWEQVSGMIESLKNGESICENHQIILHECPDGIEISDGHHRSVAMFLAKCDMKDGEYLLVQTESVKRRFGKVKDFRHETL